MNASIERLPVLVPGHIKNGLIYTELEPATDQWLRFPERTWEEVDDVLEGRLQGIQMNFDGRPSRLAQLYGVEKAASGNMSRFLAFVELLDQTRQPHDFFLSQAKATGDAWEKERDKVKEDRNKGTIGKGAADNKIKNLEVTYNPLVVADSNTAAEYERIENLILRKAVLDFFSVTNNGTETGQPLIIQDFPKLVKQAKDNFKNNSNRNNKHFADEDPINHCFDALARYLLTTKDPGLFARYSYRESYGIATTMVDCEILDNLLQFTLDSPNFSTLGDTAIRLENVGKSFFSFLTKRASYAAQSRNIEAYPYQSLLYDIFTAACYKGLPTVLKGVSQLIDKNLADVIFSSSVKNEIKSRRQNEESGLLQSYKDTHSVYAHLKRLSPFSHQLMEAIPESYFDFAATVESRIEEGLGAVYKALGAQGGRLQIQPSRTLSEFIKQDNRDDYVPGPEVDKFLDSISSEELESLLLLLKVVPRAHFQKRGVEISLQELVTIGNEREIDNFRQNTSSIAEVLKTFNDYLSGYERDSIDINLLKLYLEKQWADYESEEQLIEKENEFLWDEILDNPDWFVSPKGDRFSSKNDSQLQNHVIDSITFNIDKSYIREHIVVIRFTGFDKPIQLRLDTKRNLLTTDRYSLVVQPSQRQAFLNLILKRLYFITSGLLSKEQIAHGTEEYEEGPVYNYRRACYVHLYSTEAHPITMESNSAQEHARDIEKDYGIKIYEEIKRRRALGTLAPNEFLTFRKESEPLTSSGAVRPNDLRFNPELIQIPV